MTLHETIKLSNKHQAAYEVELERRWYELMVIVSVESIDDGCNVEELCPERLGSLALAGTI